MLGCPGVHRAAEAVPSRQHQPALRPTEHPWNRAQILDVAGLLAARRPAADVQRGDLSDDGGSPEIISETFGLVHQPAVGLESERRQLIHRFEIIRFWRALPWLQQTSLESSRRENFQVASAHLGIGIFAGYDLALFGDPDLAVHRAARLRHDGIIARSAAASDRAAPSMKQSQPNMVAREHFD